MLRVENLFQDTEYEDSRQMPHISEVVVDGGDHNLFGYILTPGGEYKGVHPCVIMSHGFPGYTTNNDLEHALRRMGCVVVHVNHRGAWGSEGNYFFSNLPEDIKHVYDWITSKERVEEFQIDTENIFLVGHSMGGMTVLNATKHLKNIRGTVAIAPYDLGYWFEHGEEQQLREMIRDEGKCLKLTSEEALFENGREYADKLALKNLAADLQSRNVLFIAADCDTIAPPDKMITPLYTQLSQQNQKQITLHTDHSLCGARIRLAKEIGAWIAQLSIS